ncbi:APC family permease [Herbiconiux daphne]|uniref:APC family permease n=1 Tax=Herbiconiux daphne TaxID=2970914 RepID=A0ABT2H707_9MICO|nr:APC family permease [Herbiconiux daphne]MCS5735687.1 APC family permease [Herbiconiux daphne]
MTAETITEPRTTALRKNAVGVPGILFFVFSAQAPLTGIVGAAGLAVALGNGAGAPGAYLIVGLIIVLFAVGFTTISRHIDTRGGFFAIVDAGLGRSFGVGGSYLAMLSYNTIQAAMYGLLGGTLSGIFPVVPWWVFSLAAIVLVWGLGSRGIELGARVLAVLVITEVVLLLVFAVIVLVTTGFAGLDVGASFSPAAILAGAPGIAILFAIASMFGFESTAIYSGEAKDPQRTVPRATYISVIAIAVFFAFVMWMLIAYYGADSAQDAALATLTTDPARFVLEPLTAVLGGWAAPVAQVLLCTSLLAGVLAFHNMVTRYFHALSERGNLPRSLAHTNRQHAPATAALTQSIVVTVLVLPFALLGLDPLTTLFAWFSGLAVAALVVLYVISSIAVIVFFRRHRLVESPWRTLVAPIVSTVLMLGELFLIITNFGTLTGSDPLTGWIMLGSIPVVFLIGFVSARAGRVGSSSAVVES